MAAREHVDLPYVDTHQIAILASRDRVWAGLRRYVDWNLTTGDHGLLGRLIDPEPRSGFAVAREVTGQELTLSGRHRFSRYLLVFDVAAAADGGIVLSASSYATFPGVHGWVYRALVIGTGAHVLATRHMLGAVRRLVDEQLG